MRRLASTMRITESAQMTAAFPGTRLAEVTLTLADGRRLLSGPLTAPGDADQPLTDEALAATFRAATTRVVGGDRALRLQRTLAHAEDHRLADLLLEAYAPAE